VTDENKLKSSYHAVVLAVAHTDFINKDWRSKLCDSGILYDVKGVLDKHTIDGRL
jgi:UDP-N-acetyl-D-galactosamine dehydrogenase